MMLKIVSPSELASLVADLIAAKTRVIAPIQVQDNAARTDYGPIRSLKDASLCGPLPRRSLKEFFFPPSEVILRFRQNKGDVEFEEIPNTISPTVVLGARPCDAAGVEILDKVMGWDYRDELWFSRREATTLVSLACPGIDGSCFCSAVGLGPDSTKGSDVLLVPTEEGYLAEVVTPKGEVLLDGRGQVVSDGDSAEEFRKTAREKVGQNLPVVPAALAEWLAKNFSHDCWKSLALACHGCGACAFVCPTCHCFDLADDREHYDQGVRRRNWDSCQTGKFTIHASGHNPRATQEERFRQRVMHKFSIYPQRFDSLLCTGCGRCARVCPAGMNLPEILGQLINLAEAEPQGSGQ